MPPSEAQQGRCCRVLGRPCAYGGGLWRAKYASAFLLGTKRICGPKVWRRKRSDALYGCRNSHFTTRFRCRSRTFWFLKILARTDFCSWRTQEFRISDLIKPNPNQKRNQIKPNPNRVRQFAASHQKHVLCFKMVVGRFIGHGIVS